MARFLAGVASTLLLVAAGFFLWTGLAHDDRRALPSPPALLAALVPSAATQTPADPPQASEATREQKRFSRYDHDRDGKVGRDEYLAARRKAFARLDTDHDGKLSFDEYVVKTAARFTAADADRSGALDATEFATTRVTRKTRPRCPPTGSVTPQQQGGEDEAQ